MITDEVSCPTEVGKQRSELVNCRGEASKDLHATSCGASCLRPSHFEGIGHLVHTMELKWIAGLEFLREATVVAGLAACDGHKFPGSEGDRSSQRRGRWDETDLLQVLGALVVDSPGANPYTCHFVGGFTVAIVLKGKSFAPEH